jgi:nickel-type superoxide dismutase maturation protease
MREAGWLDRLLFLIGRRSAYRVSGDSMRPTLADNDVVYFEYCRMPAVGDIVLAAHPYKQSVAILKRVMAIDDHGRIELCGDNADESTDSRTFGNVPIEYIKGRAVCRLKSK